MNAAFERFTPRQRTYATAAAIALVEDYLDMALARHPSCGSLPHA